MLLLIVLLLFWLFYHLNGPDFHNAENVRRYHQKKQAEPRGVHMEMSHGGIHPDID